MARQDTRVAADGTAATSQRIGRAFALAALVLGVIDYVVLALQIDWTTDVGPQALRFSPRLLVALPLAIGALAFFAAELVARRAASRARSIAIDLVCALPILACVPALFGGASIAASRFRWPFMFATLAAAWLAVAALRRLCGFALAHLPEREQARQGIGALALLGAAAGAAAPAYVSARVLRGLYPTFHIALTLVALASTAAALAIVLAANERVAERPAASGARRAFGMLACGLALWIALIGLCARSATGRNALLEHAPFASTIVPAMFAIDAAAVAASSPEVAPPASAGVPLSRARFEPGKPKPHIVLITVDALRGDIMDDGNRFGPCATELRALAQRHVSFTHAYAPSNATIHAVPGLLTGLARAGAQTPRSAYLPVVAVESGYEAQAWVTQHDLTLVDNDLTRLRKLGFHFKAYNAAYSAAKEVTAWALDALKRQEPQLVWLHLSDVHSPYSLPAGPKVAGCTMADEYGPRLATLDHALGLFIAQLEARSDVVWAFTADHGESRGERGVYGHDSSLFDEQVRVPLILGGAGTSVARSETEVTNLDLAATLLEMAGATLPANTPRLPWRGNGAASAPHRPAISFDKNGCTVTRDRLKLLIDANAGTLLLFDLASDPEQQRNVAAEHAAAAKQLFGLLTPPLCSEQVGKLAWLLPR